MVDRGLTPEERWQDDIRGYTDRLLALAQSLPGFAGAEFRYETREVIVFAVDGPSEAATELIRQAPAGVRTTWRDAPYPQRELTAEVKRLMSPVNPFRLTTGAARHDGTGLDFTAVDSELLAAKDPQTLLGARYPVTVTYGGYPEIGTA